jgi:Protein of unknown function (DUF3667)
VLFQFKMMDQIATNHCRNCDSALSRGQAYCGSCGQRCDFGRLTIGQIGHDLVHALTHVDRSVLSLLRPLITRPGYVARDYVEGRRKRYFGPFAWLVVIVGIVSAEIALSGFHAVISNRPKEFDYFLQRHINIVFLIEVPVHAVFCRILFWKDAYNAAEFLVLAAYAASVRLLFLGVVVVPASTLFHPPLTAEIYGAYAFQIGWAAYFGFASSQFSTGGRIAAWFKGGAAALIAPFVIPAAASVMALLWYR